MQSSKLLKHRVHPGQTPSTRSLAVHMKQLRSDCFRAGSYVHGADRSGLQPQPEGTADTPIFTLLAHADPVPATAAKNLFSSEHSLVLFPAIHSFVPLLLW